MVVFWFLGFWFRFFFFFFSFFLRFSVVAFFLFFFFSFFLSFLLAAFFWGVGGGGVDCYSSKRKGKKRLS